MGTEHPDRQKDRPAAATPRRSPAYRKASNGLEHADRPAAQPRQPRRHGADLVTAPRDRTPRPLPAVVRAITPVPVRSSGAGGRQETPTSGREVGA